jgi:hypothetical protein
VRAEYRDHGEAGVLTPAPSDLLVATCEAPDAAEAWIVVTVGLEHLLSLGGGYVQPLAPAPTCGPASIPREAYRPDPAGPRLSPISQLSSSTIVDG